MTGLYFLKRLIVVDILWPIVKVDNDLGVTIGKETIDRMIRVIAFVVDEMIDESIKRKPRNVSSENHRQIRSPVTLIVLAETVDNIIQLADARTLSEGEGVINQPRSGFSFLSTVSNSVVRSVTLGSGSI